MIDCLILGDSIALGVGQVRTACETVARVGVSSANYVHTLFGPAPKVAAHIVISLGVNDDPSAHTLEMLRLMRRQLRAGTVTWLLPGLREGARRAIGAVAAENGDRLVDTRAQAGPDGLHPTGAGYRQIAASALGGGAPAASPTPVLRAAAALPVNPVRWLPMVQTAPVRQSFVSGYPFRLWAPLNSAPGSVPRVTPILPAGLHR